MIEGGDFPFCVKLSTATGSIRTNKRVRCKSPTASFLEDIFHPILLKEEHYFSRRVPGH